MDANFDTAIKLEAEIRESLEPFGLLPLGWFEVEEKKPALMVGNLAGSQWSAFSSSTFAVDGDPDPMNRWTKSVINPVADSMRCTALFPFGDEVWPFQKWASTAMGLKQSPIGLLIHPQYGLWFALRGALVFDHRFLIPDEAKLPHPCDDCSDKPCLDTCPVGAFTVDTYDVAACREHVSRVSGADCAKGGCLARRACPVGREYAYCEAQQAFHMSYFM